MIASMEMVNATLDVAAEYVFSAHHTRRVVTYSPKDDEVVDVHFELFGRGI